MKKYAILLLTLLILTRCESDDPIQYQLSTLVNPPEAGTIYPSSGTFGQGEEITFKATPKDEYIFKNWSDDASGEENPMTVIMTEDMFVTANFEKRVYPLTMKIEGEGTVKEEIVHSKSTDYSSGTIVQLTAIPDQDWKFARWEGPIGQIKSNPMEVSILGPVTITAVFERVTYALTIEIEGKGTVKEEVIQSKSSHEYPSGTKVRLTAIPNDGWEFVGWSGSYQSTDNSLILLMTKIMTIRATFRPLEMGLVYLPDDIFEEALIDLGYDDVMDDFVNPALIIDVEELRLNNLGIEDLTGIEGFKNLKVLSLSNNNLQSLDISQNHYLNQLILDNNRLRSLDVSRNVGLYMLVAVGNELSCIKVNPLQISYFSQVGPDGLPNLEVDEGVTMSISCDVTVEDKTYVPDDNFEQALIDLGLDDRLDNYVKTMNIISVRNLNVSGYNISELTGLQDFVSLFYLNCSNNNIRTIEGLLSSSFLDGFDQGTILLSNNNLSHLDISKMLCFGLLDVRNNPLTCIQVNEFQMSCLGFGGYSMAQMTVEADKGVELSLDCGQ